MSEIDWNRLKVAFLKARSNSALPDMYIYATITDLRDADNKGIDFVIRRLWNSDYRQRFDLHGGPLVHFALKGRAPLRVRGHRLFYPESKESKYLFLSIPEITFPKREEINRK